jgi:ketosteroid isomerase-like protein
MAEATLDVVRAVYAAWNRANFPGPPELLGPDIEYVNPPDAVEPGTRHGLAAFTRALTKTLEGWETWQMEVEEISGHGEDVAVVVRYRARGRASGAEVEGRESALWTVRAGKIVRYAWFHGHTDASRAMRERAGTA